MAFQLHPAAVQHTALLSLLLWRSHTVSISACDESQHSSHALIVEFVIDAMFTMAEGGVCGGIMLLQCGDVHVLKLRQTPVPWWQSISIDNEYIFHKTFNKLQHSLVFRP